MERAVSLIVRIFITSALTAIAGACVWLAYDYLVGPNRFGAEQALGGLLFLAAFAFPFVLVGVVLVGLPVSWLLGRFSLENLLSYGLLGAAIGAPIALFFLELPAPLGALFGAVAAVIWWALKKHPKRASHSAVLPSA